MFEQLCADLAFGITALRARAVRQHSVELVQRNLQAMVQTVATTVELRDPYTAGHQRSVARLADAIATELGLDDDAVAGIVTAAGIHDIGKIAVPAEILSKPSRLTRPEYEIIQADPQAGHDMLGEIEFPWPVADMTLQHHERMDGSGYPAGLNGTEILLGARILAVADTVDAMASHRPYRPGKGVAAALEQLQIDRGGSLDADVVDACLCVFSDGKFELS